MNRRKFLTLAGALPIFSTLPAGAEPRWRPSKPVTCVIPFSPGGGVDMIFRHVRDHAAERGITMVAEYRGGADGLIGMRASSAAPGDGHHLAFGTIGTLSHRRDGFDAAASHRLITALRDSLFFLVTGSNSGIDSVNDLLARIRSGDRITGGSGAPGQRASMESFLKGAGINDAYITNYRGANGVLQDLIGNHIQWSMMSGFVAANAIRAGQIKLLATDRRPEDGGDTTLPTIFDRVPVYPRINSHVVAGPGAMSDESFLFWSDFFREYLNLPSTQAAIISDHGTLVPFGPGYLRERIDLYRQTVVQD